MSFDFVQSSKHPFSLRILDLWQIDALCWKYACSSVIFQLRWLLVESLLLSMNISSNWIACKILVTFMRPLWEAVLPSQGFYHGQTPFTVNMVDTSNIYWNCTPNVAITGIGHRLPSPSRIKALYFTLQYHYHDGSLTYNKANGFCFFCFNTSVLRVSGYKIRR